MPNPVRRCRLLRKDLDAAQHRERFRFLAPQLLVVVTERRAKALNRKDRGGELAKDAEKNECRVPVRGRRKHKRGTVSHAP